MGYLAADTTTTVFSTYGLVQCGSYFPHGNRGSDSCHKAAGAGDDGSSSSPRPAPRPSPSPRPEEKKEESSNSSTTATSNDDGHEASGAQPRGGRNLGPQHQACQAL